MINSYSCAFSGTTIRKVLRSYQFSQFSLRGAQLVYYICFSCNSVTENSTGFKDVVGTGMDVMWNKIMEASMGHDFTFLPFQRIGFVVYSLLF